MGVRVVVSRCLALVVVCVAAVVVLGVGSASAATFTATDTASFETAVNDANATSGSNTIMVAAGTYLPTATVVFSNTSGTTTVEGPSVNAAGQTSTAKLAGTSVVPFPSDFIDVNTGATVVFDDLEITGGGEAGVNPSINDFGTLTVNDSALSGNPGFQIQVESSGTATVNDSTVAKGGAYGIVDDGTLSLFNSTVAYNKGGIDDANGTLNLTNSIVAENASGVATDCTAVATTSDHSLDSDGTCGVGALSSKNPTLVNSFQSPEFNGGTTPDYALTSGSPAIGAGDEATCLPTDQRGYHYNNPCDIGSVAFNPPLTAQQQPPPTTSTTPASTAPSGGSGAAGGTSPAGSGVTDNGVSGGGKIRGAHDSSISFEIRVVRGQRVGTFTYADSAKHVSIRAVSISQVTIDTAQDSATIRGLASTTGKGKRKTLRFTASIDCSNGGRLSVRLSSGYSHGGTLTHGSLQLTAQPGPASAP